MDSAVTKNLWHTCTTNLTLQSSSNLVVQIYCLLYSSSSGPTSSDYSQQTYTMKRSRGCLKTLSFYKHNPFLHTHSLSTYVFWRRAIYIQTQSHSTYPIFSYIPNLFLHTKFLSTYQISLYTHNLFLYQNCRDVFFLNTQSLSTYTMLTYTIPKMLSFHIHNDLMWKQAANRQIQKLRRNSLSSRLRIDACVLCVGNLKWEGGSEARGETKRKKSVLHILYVCMCVRICACMCVSVRASARMCPWVLLSVLNVCVLCQIVVCLAFVFGKCVRGFIFV